MIASFVAIMPTRPAQLQAPAAERLAEMLAVRRQLSAEKVAAENAARLLEDAMLQRLSRRRIGRLAADIDVLDERMVEIVADRCRARSSLSAAHLHARRRRRAGMHAACAVA